MGEETSFLDRAMAGFRVQAGQALPVAPGRALESILAARGVVPVNEFKKTLTEDECSISGWVRVRKGTVGEQRTRAP